MSLNLSVFFHSYYLSQHMKTLMFNSIHFKSFIEFYYVLVLLLPYSNFFIFILQSTLKFILLIMMKLFKVIFSHNPITFYHPQLPKQTYKPFDCLSSPLSHCRSYQRNYLSSKSYSTSPSLNTCSTQYFSGWYKTMPHSAN
jgi:hypothetical protein